MADKYEGGGGISPILKDIEMVDEYMQYECSDYIVLQAFKRIEDYIINLNNSTKGVLHDF